MSVHPVPYDPEPTNRPETDETRAEHRRTSELLRLERYNRSRQLLAARSYVLLGELGGEYSADAPDYWDVPDTAVLGALIRRNHPYITNTGTRVRSARLVKSQATAHDLRRLQHAAESMAGVIESGG